MKFAALSILSAFLLFGCVSTPTQAEKPIRRYKPLSKELNAQGLPKDFVDVPELKDVMESMVMQNAAILWKITGKEDSPVTDDGWEQLDYAAIAIIETTKFLRVSDLSKDDEEWPKRLDGLVAAITSAREAIKERDGDKLFDVGGQIEEACATCHKEYYVEDQ